jgi:uncharacterized glyoxalase superfamily protein PhnB
MLEDATAFFDFTKAVFDAETIHRNAHDNGMLQHGEIQIGGSTIMFSNSRDDWKPATANMFVYVEDADEVYAKALANGAESVMPPADQECGVTDPFGNVWWITSAAAVE